MCILGIERPEQRTSQGLKAHQSRIANLLANAGEMAIHGLFSSSPTVYG